MLVYPNPTASVAPSALVFGIVFGMCVHSKGSHGLLLTVLLALLVCIGAQLDVHHVQVSGPPALPQPLVLEQPPTPVPQHPPQGTLVVYAYHEANLEYQRRLRFFLRFGLQPDVDYIFVMNGPCSVPIPNTPNVQVLQRDNAGFDFGAWAAALKHGNGQLQYKFFVFLNGSVKGPYRKDWLAAVTGMLSSSVKAVGLTLNCPDGHGRPLLHLQSMIWATDTEGMAVLRHGGLFDRDFSTYQEATDAESALTTLLYASGYRVSSFQTAHLGLEPPAEVDGCLPTYPHDIWKDVSAQALPSTLTFPFVKEKYLPYINVLLVSHHFDADGAPRQLLLLGQKMQTMGMLVEVATPDAGGALREEFEAMSMPVHSLPQGDQIKGVQELHKSMDYDLVIFNTMVYSVLEAAWAVPGATSVLWAHENATQLSQFLGKYVMLHETPTCVLSVSASSSHLPCTPTLFWNLPHMPLHVLACPSYLSYVMAFDPPPPPCYTLHG